VLPVWTVAVYFAAVLAVNWIVGLILNGTQEVHYSSVELGEDSGSHADECWIYLNGVSIGCATQEIMPT